MSNQLKLTIEGFSNLKDDGAKVWTESGYRIQLIINNQRLLFEETLPRRSVPVDPTAYLARRMTEILATYLPQIDPEPYA